MFDGWESDHGCVGRTWADLAGYRRVFNKKSVENWGTKKRPGLTLNLKESATSVCRGIAFEFIDDDFQVAGNAQVPDQARGLPTPLIGHSVARRPRCPSPCVYLRRQEHPLRPPPALSNREARYPDRGGRAATILCAAPLHRMRGREIVDHAQRLLKIASRVAGRLGKLS
jgi:hypothetical protein